MNDRRHRLFGLCAPIFALAVGCMGGDDVGGDAGGSGGLKVEAFEGECSMLFSCGCEYVGFADAAECAEVFAVEWAGIEASANGAGLTPDFACYRSTRPFAAHGCMNGYEEAEAMPACSYCQHGYGAKAAGEPCKAYDDRLSECAQGLRCPPGKDATCEDPCATAGEGQSCEVMSCAEGLACTLDDQTCVKPGGLGEPCAFTDHECEEGLICHLDAHTCEPRRGLGEDCTFVGCEIELFCPEGPDRICAKRGALGEPCDMAPCAMGLACDFQTLTCGPIPGVGEPCTGECAEGAICIDVLPPMPPMDPVCMAIPGEGEPCVLSMCAEGLLCDETETCVREPSLVCIELY